MGVKIPDKKRLEILDHINNTAHELIKAYSIKQLAFIEGKSEAAIKRDPRFLPIRIDTYHKKYTLGLQTTQGGTYKKGYSVLYIRLDEIKHIYKKKTGRKLITEY